MIRFLAFIFILCAMFFPIFFIVKKILIWCKPKFDENTPEDEYSEISNQYNNLTKEMNDELNKIARKQKRYETLSNKINRKDF